MFFNTIEEARACARKASIQTGQPYVAALTRSGIWTIERL